MRVWIYAFVIAILSLVPAAAAERVLLLPDGAQARMAGKETRPGEFAALRSTAATKGTVRVIVGLRVPFAPEGALSPREGAEQRRDIASAGVALRARFSTTIARQPEAVRSYGAIPFMAMEVTAPELDRLAADPDVISLAEDRRNRATLAESTSLIRAPEAWAQGATGLGQTIAIIDSGVDKTHPFLAGKVVSEACYSRGGFCPGGATSSTAPGSGVPCNNPECLHGTHVAGIAAGKGASFSGVARDATLIAIQVFSPDGEDITAWDSDVLAAVNRVYDLRTRFRIAAVNLSLGGDRFFAPCNEPAALAAVATLRSAGIATVVASGNDGWTDSIASPACVPGAVSVGSVSDSDWGLCDGATTAADKVACYSNTAPFLSLLAPGSAIYSSIPGGFYATLHGTSMAAPHVAGAWAVIRQKMPTASVATVLAQLQGTGKMVSDDRAPTIVKPRIDVAAALVVNYPLTYVRAGTGSGTVRFVTPKGITSCRNNCALSLPGGTSVTATALPAAGARFAGWSGACTGTARCSIAIAGATSLTATFAPTAPPVTLTYAKLGSGAGSVRFVPAGGVATCSKDCTQRYATGTKVTLTALPAGNARFTGWSGACQGKGTCTITLTRDRSVRATFTRR